MTNRIEQHHPVGRARSIQCRVCGGPVRSWAGDVHGWTCRACLADYIALQRTPRPETIARTNNTGATR